MGGKYAPMEHTRAADGEESESVTKSNVLWKPEVHIGLELVLVVLNH